MKQGFLLLCLSFSTIVILELLAYFPLRGIIQKSLPYYARSVLDLSRAYPQGHFKADPLLGFDLNPHSRGLTFSHPYERGEYSIWVNSFGCFDKEWDIEQLTGGIYLAGDSFTWGYAPYEETFGAQLQKVLASQVYSCGVSHTGQRHQFKKFKRLFDQGIQPDVVIVNLYENDPDNDYFFPHTQVVDGHMIEDVFSCMPRGESDEFWESFSYQRASREQLEQEYQYRLDRSASLLERSLVVLLFSAWKEKFFSQEEVSSCLRSVYGGHHGLDDDNYADHFYSAKQREAIANWIEHARVHNYRLIFSLIPTKESWTHERRGVGHFDKGLIDYIHELSGEVVSFSTFLKETEFVKEPLKLYYRYDGHFNARGHEVYSLFLKELMN